ncbi:MAG: ABC transporter ATP-binding protein [Candidatus Heimdallarchaeota archaeon]|nr:ABC transporter ATP-binding protein [Candidatus Heimdallarchaeota archaeon]MDH5644686.1 ABC transporter ATP-binding protein [Candidatus Heimdallarchaeota archaeon]
MNSVVQMKFVSKFIQNRAIIQRLNLEVPGGTLFGLLGPNGAGKTTAINLMTGNLRPTSGMISIFGMDPWKNRVDLYKKVGFLPQNSSFYPDKQVIQSLTYMARLKGIARRDAKIEARETLAMVGLTRFEQQKIGKLSGGERQRLGFANAIIGDPELLILDEPTASLDPEGRIYIMNLISKLSRDEKKTVVISSHILPEIQRMTNYIAILNQGEMLISGSMKQLTRNIYDDMYEIETSHPVELLQHIKDLNFNAYMDETTIMVNTNGNLLALWSEVPKICTSNNYQLRSFKPAKDALENLFIDLVSRKRTQEVNK